MGVSEILFEITVTVLLIACLMIMTLIFFRENQKVPVSGTQGTNINKKGKVAKGKLIRAEKINPADGGPSYNMYVIQGNNHTLVLYSISHQNHELYKKNNKIDRFI